MKARNHTLFICGLIFILILPHVSSAQVFAQFGSSSFNTPTNEPFVETYLYINGPALFAHEGGGGFHNSVNVAVKITKDSTIVKANKYNLKGPQFQRNTEAPGFIDQQRYSLPPGDYHIELNITDNYTIRKRTLTIHDSIHLAYPKNAISLSEIQPVDSYSKAVEPGPLTKSGLDLVPLVGAFYPQNMKQLNFYVEAYKTEQVLGKAQSFVYVYYLETAPDQTKMNSFGSFKKQTAAAVNPLLGKIDISNLGTGNYHLVVELRDVSNKLICVKRLAIQRQNQMMEITTLQKLSEKEKEAQYFGRIQNADTLKMLVECLWPIANAMDKERIINQSVKKDPDLMKKYIVDFWEQRAADTANPVRMWGAYYQEVQKAMAIFKCGKQPGYYTDRGRVFLQYGAPSIRSIQQSEDNTYPYEIWQYYRTTDQTNGQFFSNRKFVFVNKTLGDDCFKLIHSDMRGETNNSRWQFEITRRNNNGMANPDNDTPAGTEYNRMNEIYNNPR